MREALQTAPVSHGGAARQKLASQYCYTLSFISLVLDTGQQGRHNAARLCPERWWMTLSRASLAAYAQRPAVP